MRTWLAAKPQYQSVIFSESFREGGLEGRGWRKKRRVSSLLDIERPVSRDGHIWAESTVHHLMISQVTVLFTVDNRPKAHKRQNAFNQTKQDRMQSFEGYLVFKATNNKEQRNHLAAASWVLPKGCVVETPPWQNPTGSSEVICLFLYCLWL